jgi:hypothetical protein
MLVICCGMAKSGSTLSFELVKGVLIDAGYSQAKVKSIGIKPRGHGNHIADLSREAVLDVIERIGPGGIVAAKTHKCFSEDMFCWMEELQAERKIQIVVSYRDPRDVCLSLVDHGAKARESGRPGFARIHDLAHAADVFERAIPKFRKWGSMRGSLRLHFDTMAFSPDAAIDAIERALGVVCDHEAAKRHAFEDAFTQRNKAKKNRFEEELDEAQNRELAARFSEFIERVCLENDEGWFTAYRDQALAGRGADCAPLGEPDT